MPKITNMAKVEDILSKVLVVKLERDRKGAKGSPFRKGIEELGLVVIETEVILSVSDASEHGIIAVCTQVLSGLKVHWSWAAHKIGACTVRSWRDYAWLKLIDVVMSAVGEVRKAKGVVVVGHMTLVKDVCLAYFQTNCRIESVAALVESVVSCFASIEIHLCGEFADITITICHANIISESDTTACKREEKEKG